MDRYFYEARSLTGIIKKGVIEAKDESEARVKVRAMELIPITLRVPSSVNDKKNEVQKISFFSRSVKTKELQFFTSQFATLVNAGIPIIEALKILLQGRTDYLIKDAVIQVIASLESGKSLSDSLSQHPQVFDRLYCHLVHAGEEAGSLELTLLRLSNYCEKSEKIKSQIKGSFFRPVSFLFIAILVIVSMCVFIFPKFEEISKSSGKHLPQIIQAVANLSGWLQHHCLAIIIGILAASCTLMAYLNTLEGKRNFDRMILNTPIIGKIVLKLCIVRMGRTMAALLSSGTQLFEAIEIASQTAGNHVIARDLQNCIEAVRSGQPFNEPLSRQKKIPRTVSQMVLIGEQSGKLDVMLGKVADFYEEEIENSIRGLISIIEPIIVVGLGGLIAFMLVSMLLPIYQLGALVG